MNDRDLCTFETEYGGWIRIAETDDGGVEIHADDGGSQTTIRLTRDQVRELRDALPPRSHHMSPPASVSLGMVIGLLVVIVILLASGAQP